MENNVIIVSYVEYIGRCLFCCTVPCIQRNMDLDGLEVTLSTYILVVFGLNLEVFLRYFR
jgi:hypothetical protein